MLMLVGCRSVAELLSLLPLPYLPLTCAHLWSMVAMVSLRSAYSAESGEKVSVGPECEKSDG
jgi:hypothetical protein